MRVLCEKSTQNASSFSDQDPTRVQWLHDFQKFIFNLPAAAATTAAAAE
jgi:hypothetical protein